MVSASPQLFGVRRPTVPRGHLNPFNIFLVKLHSLSYLLFRLSITSSTNTASSMNPQSTPQELQAARSPSSYRSRASTFRQHASQYKWLICFLAGVIILIMAIGLLFVAHQYYHEFGGQGWLKVRDKSQEQEDVFARNLFLPLKKRKGWITDLQRRSPEDEVPFYQCGDQENSCEAYNQPNICCPPWAICYVGSITLSGIFCCNASVSQFDCQDSESHPPKCLASLVECPAETGGGCCPQDDICSPNGCIHILSVSTVGTSLDSTTTYSESATSGPDSSSISSSGTNSVGLPITITNTVIEAPAATSTLTKEGEVAQVETGSKGSVVSILFVPHSSAWLLVLVAVLMALR
ncbi:hypothetical protein L207DRAFT_578136 [Hyaloscypha variabilis F]|uniref:Uncharacterized protein n=1 Tax=Hyaloscypha variabilis (strain UAMH 11265 / GT02V1 / F) TaxID=1149755 RepID=A0A2J6S347_HYAVF|nr:hypothetical protein L207DRAFT_578136 [Hyaloscypha variabilis F]